MPGAPRAITRSLVGRHAELAQQRRRDSDAGEQHGVTIDAEDRDRRLVTVGDGERDGVADVDVVALRVLLVDHRSVVAELGEELVARLAAPVEVPDVGPPSSGRSR